jgi:nucleotide-binding universal stress UspA family protein
MAIFKKILCPLDFSKHSHRALDIACELARDNQASLTLLHAYAIPSYPLPEGYVLASSETVAEILSKTQQAMNEARARALASGVASVEVVMSEGAPFAEIVRAAREHKSDLIVIATHGRTGLKHALLGSVTEKVVRKAPCAVLTVRDSAQEFVRP